MDIYIMSAANDDIYRNNVRHHMYSPLSYPYTVIMEATVKHHQQSLDDTLIQSSAMVLHKSPETMHSVRP